MMMIFIGITRTGKHTKKTMENHHFFMGKSAIIMAIFKFANCKCLLEGRCNILRWVSRSGGTPSELAGWFSSGKIELKLMIYGYPHIRKAPHECAADVWEYPIHGEIMVNSGIRVDNSNKLYDRMNYSWILTNIDNNDGY